MRLVCELPGQCSIQCTTLELRPRFPPPLKAALVPQGRVWILDSESRSWIPCVPSLSCHPAEGTPQPVSQCESDPLPDVALAGWGLCLSSV